jgi:mRNA-degrading endonuclease RelE of RelBE toxin-antitoxin system
LRYEVVFLNTFLKQFKKLPGNVKERVKQRVQELATNPYLGLRLRGGLDSFWKDRVGTYRIKHGLEHSEQVNRQVSSAPQRNRTDASGYILEENVSWLCGGPRTGFDRPRRI